MHGRQNLPPDCSCVNVLPNGQLATQTFAPSLLTMVALPQPPVQASGPGPAQVDAHSVSHSWQTASARSVAGLTAVVWK